MGLIKQTSSQYYEGEAVYNPTGTATNAVVWPSSLTPLIWDASATPTSVNNFKVFVDSVQQYPTLDPYNLSQSLSTSIVDGVRTQTLTLTSKPDVTSIVQNSTATGFVIGQKYTVVNGGSQVGVGTGLILQAVTNTTGAVTIFSDGSGYANGDTVQITGQGVTGTATYTVSTTTTNIPVTSIITVKLINSSLWDNYKSYQYINLKDIVNNFMVAYVGTDKLIPRVKRSDVIFHAKRGLQEFSYDTLRSVKSQELTIPPSLSLVLPQDYVNYVQLSWVDGGGVKHIIYPTTLTSNPTNLPVQDNSGIPTQDIYGNSLQATQSLVNDRWRSANATNVNGNETLADINSNANVFDWSWWKMAYGQRYGLDPVVSQKNGWFTIDERRGVFAFSSDLANKLITLEYISDGLAYDEDTKVPKMAEDALYAYMTYNIIAYRPKTPEYIVQRFKKEKSAKLRNAKIRLSNIKLGEFTQVMRGKSKWIKH
jgi:hypothetical protein